jgi:hypothetical protein
MPQGRKERTLQYVRVRNAVTNLRTQLLVLILFGFLNTLSAGWAASGSEGEHLGGAGASEGVGSPGTSNSEASGDERGGGGLALSFRYVPACSDYNPPGTADSAAPFGGAGGTGLNDLACNDDYQPLSPPPDQQAGQIAILGQDSDAPKLVPPKASANQTRGETVENPDR